MFQRRILESDIHKVKAISLKGNPVIAEFAKIRERERGEKIHLRLKEALSCSACGVPLALNCDATPWMDSTSQHQGHPDQCAKYEEPKDVDA